MRKEARYQGAWAFMWDDHYFQSNIMCDGETIYSYGHHFPMATKIRGSDDIWVNTGKYSVTTSKHQSALREVLSLSGYAKTGDGWTFNGHDGSVWSRSK